MYKYLLLFLYCDSSFAENCNKWHYYVDRSYREKFLQIIRQIRQSLVPFSVKTIVIELAGAWNGNATSQSYNIEKGRKGDNYHMGGNQPRNFVTDCPTFLLRIFRDWNTDKMCLLTLQANTR